MDHDNSPCFKRLRGGVATVSSLPSSTSTTLAFAERKTCVYPLSMLPASIEMEVYHLLSLLELALLRIICRGMNDRIAWFVKSHYKGSVDFLETRRRLDSPDFVKFTTGSMTCIRRLRIDPSSYRDEYLVGLLKLDMHHSTIEELDIRWPSASFLLAVARFDFAKLTSLRVDTGVQWLEPD